MPAEVVVVFADRRFSDGVVSRLRAANRDVAALPDSMEALTALEGAVRIELLVTCLDFGPGKPNGIALARMARLRRPGIKVLFVGDGALSNHAAGLGAFLASPVKAEDVVSEVARLLASDER